MTALPRPVDLAAYLARIGDRGPLEVDRATLDRLHLAHLLAIPFENVDIHLGRPIRIDIRSVQDKLVAEKRGGYCFEHNTLFAAVLEALGFPVRRLGARVGKGDPTQLKRTHMVLLVRVEGADVIADVGFGAGSILEPVDLAPGVEVVQHGRRFRIAETTYGYALQRHLEDGWNDFYHFTLEEQYDVDRIVANHYTSTHPDSGFVKTLTAQRESLEAYWILRGLTLTEVAEDHVRERTLDEDQLIEVLRSVFGLPLPASTVLRAPG